MTPFDTFLITAPISGALIMPEARNEPIERTYRSIPKYRLDIAVRKADGYIPTGCRSIPSSQQQDLSGTTLLRHCLSLGRFTEWQLQANQDYQLAVSHRLGHELERFPVEVRDYRHHL